MKQIVSKDRQVLAVLLGVMILMTILIVGMPSKAFAADKPGYNYRVEVYSGEQGLYDGQTEWKKDFAPGSNIAIDVRDCKVTNDKYYIRGFRVAGHDNDETTGYQTINIDNLDTDVSYEIAYGIKGAMVQYTVKYVDENGEDLLAKDTFYGMPGDEPVVAYRYVDGYMPHVISLSKTLSEDESQNVFTFKYSKSTGTTTTVTRYINATAPGTPGNPAGTGAAGTANAGGNAGGNNGGAAINDGGVPLAQPNQYQDLDEGDTPQDAGVVNGINIVPYLVGGGIGLLILILLILLLLRRRRHAAETADATEL